MKRHSLLSLLLPWVLATGLYACASDKTSDPITSSQTHWLSKCDDSSDCDGDFQCVCGLCTASCKEEASCSELGTNSTCAPTDGASACGNAAPDNICVQHCKAGKCAAGLECVNDACLPMASTGDAGGPAPEPTTPSNTPPGVNCDAYPTCDVNTQCATGECYSFAECSSAICIDGNEACTLSCPNPDTCMTLDSYPAQLACEDKVPAIPNSKPDAPVGLVCSDYYACSLDLPCESGTCFSFDECGGAICVEQDTACSLTCPDPDNCALAKSIPPQITCEGRVAPKPGNPKQPEPTEPTDPNSSTDGGMPGPKGVDCSEHVACGVNSPACPEGQDCMSLGCNVAICIETDIACEESCPDPKQCALLESFPEQISCDGRVPAHGEANPGPDGGSVVTCGDSVCTTGGRCCDHCTGECSSLELVCPDDVDPNHSCDLDAGAGEVCGNTVCGANERCCNPCTNSCASIFTDIACPTDTGTPMCDENTAFACGDQTC
ncbi:MAG TPA: hypothetical protein VHM70_25425, partial [Polyangiaceae bacterium]|nr:hypothetical protein [Polyangiaceae bacterium]